MANRTKPKIANISVGITYERIFDPQTGVDRGKKVIIQFQRDRKNISKELYLLADLSPINFLYYGVPTEIMDPILSQLLSVSIGLCHSHYHNLNLPPKIYAVNKQIDEKGNLLKKAKKNLEILN